MKSELKTTLTDIETMKTHKSLLAYGIKDLFTRHIKKSKIKDSLILQSLSNIYITRHVKLQKNPFLIIFICHI